MAKKKSKLSTPAWILEDYDSEEEYNKARQGTKSPTSSKQSDDSSTKGILKKKNEKTFKIKKCPKCDSDNVNILVGKEIIGEWECKECGWKGTEIKEEELTEEEFMKYLDENGEEVA